jgi:phosphatidate cytidylyltransferase
VDPQNEDPTRGTDSEEQRPAEEPRTRTEGVRIIGADEAAAALDSGQAAGRRPEDAPRFGDVPEPPVVAGAPPAARFPLPDAMDPTEVPRPPLAGGPRSGDLPHWTEPPTGEVPAVLGGGAEVDEDDLAAWQGLNRPGARWRDHPRDWDDAHFEDAADLAGVAAEEEAYQDVYDLTSPTADLAPEAPQEDLAIGPPPPARRLWRRPARPVVPVVGGLPDPHADDPMAAIPDVPAPTPPWSDAAEAAGSPPRPAGAGVRVATGIGVGILALLLLKAGPGPALGLVTAVALVAAAEAFGVLRRAGYRPATLLGLTATVAVMVGAYLRGEAALPLVASLTTVFSFLWYLAGVVHARAVRNIGATLAGFMWVGFLGSYAGLLLDPDVFPHRHGEAFLLGALVAAVSYDVGGFVVGSRLGRRPLAPHVSPNKTWEGLIGGMAATLVVSAAVVSQIHPWTFHDAVALGLVAAVTAPLGDLCQSLVKRDLGIKDMGTLLPGHGGLLDRVDAILFVIPATYYLVRVLGLG